MEKEKLLPPLECASGLGDLLNVSNGSRIRLEIISGLEYLSVVLFTRDEERLLQFLLERKKEREKQK